MDHIAIMNKRWKLIDCIIAGQKTIESRWYRFKRDPWNKVSEQDTIYFKDAGCPITAYAKVEKVIQFDGLSENRIKEIYSKYGKKIFPSDFDVATSINDKLKKNYCILIFLKDVKRIEKPFNIDKKGFGNANAWLCVDNIEKIKVQ